MPVCGTVYMVNATLRNSSIRAAAARMTVMVFMEFRMFLGVGDWPDAPDIRDDPDKSDGPAISDKSGRGTDILAPAYLMLSTKLKRRFHLMPENPRWSGSLDHQMNIGLPTIWSSGTKPQ